MFLNLMLIFVERIPDLRQLLKVYLDILIRAGGETFLFVVVEHIRFHLVRVDTFPRACLDRIDQDYLHHPFQVLHGV